MLISDWSSDVCSSDLLHLQLSDFGKLRTRDLTGGNLARFLGTRLQLGGLLDQEGCRRRLRREGKAAIRINGDDRGDRHALFKIAGRRVERFAERSEEHTSELQSLMRISYAVFCLKKKNKKCNK